MNKRKTGPVWGEGSEVCIMQFTSIKYPIAAVRYFASPFFASSNLSLQHVGTDTGTLCHPQVKERIMLLNFTDTFQESKGRMNTYALSLPFENLKSGEYL